MYNHNDSIYLEDELIMKKLCFFLILIVIIAFSSICRANDGSSLRVVVGQFSDDANKSVWSGAKPGIENTELGNLTTSSAATYVMKELINSGEVIIPGRRTQSEGDSDLYVSGSVTNCAVKVSSIGYENNKHESSIENRKYTIVIDLVVFVEDYNSEIMLFCVDGHGESSCTGTEVKYAEHTVNVGSERVTDDSIKNGIEKASREAVKKMLKNLKKLK